MSDAHASSPSVVWSEPIKTRSGVKKSLIAVPSTRNSVLERILKRQLGFELALGDTTCGKFMPWPLIDQTC